MRTIVPEPLSLVKRHRARIKDLHNDPVAAAKAAKLVYVSCTDEGIRRLKSGKGFKYVLGNAPVKDKDTLHRIRALVLPPAWQDVWICTRENGHLQATGKDVMGRKQYRYHPLWMAIRNETKFFRLHAFGHALPSIRQQLQKDLSLPGLPQRKVLALVVTLMEKTGIRVGNEFYEKLYGSFGLTTLKDKHVTIQGNAIKFAFKGKKGVEHSISLKSKKLAKLVRNCRDIPGKELFQYIDEDGKRQAIESGMVNDYIREIAGEDFTAKDLRTWSGSLVAMQALNEAGPFESEREAKRKVVEALDKVSIHLGNTRTVCRKYYVHPVLTSIYEKGEWEKCIGNCGELPSNGLSKEEHLLLSIIGTG